MRTKTAEKYANCNKKMLQQNHKNVILYIMNRSNNGRYDCEAGNNIVNKNILKNRNILKNILNPSNNGWYDCEAGNNIVICGHKLTQPLTTNVCRTVWRDKRITKPTLK